MVTIDVQQMSAANEAKVPISQVNILIQFMNFQLITPDVYNLL